MNFDKNVNNESDLLEEYKQTINKLNELKSRPTTVKGIIKKEFKDTSLFTLLGCLGLATTPLTGDIWPAFLVGSSLITIASVGWAGAGVLANLSYKDTIPNQIKILEMKKRNLETKIKSKTKTNNKHITRKKGAKKQPTDIELYELDVKKKLGVSEEVFFSDWPDLEVTEATREAAKNNPNITDARLGSGRFRTDKEEEERRKILREIPLTGEVIEEQLKERVRSRKR